MKRSRAKVEEMHNTRAHSSRIRSRWRAAQHGQCPQGAAGPVRVLMRDGKWVDYAKDPLLDRKLQAELVDAPEVTPEPDLPW